LVQQYWLPAEPQTHFSMAGSLHPFPACAVQHSPFGPVEPAPPEGVPPEAAPPDAEPLAPAVPPAEVAGEPPELVELAPPVPAELPPAEPPFDAVAFASLAPPG
jgi:hypothetical protein